MRQFHIKLVLFLVFTFFGGSAFAEIIGLGGGFFGTGKNTVGISSNSPKEVLRERQAKKAAALSNEKKAEIARNEQPKESIQPNSDHQNPASKKNRMTLEERRALRRQIHDAGSDVYVSPK